LSFEQQAALDLSLEFKQLQNLASFIIRRCCFLSVFLVFFSWGFL
jgi:hypothetical protein